MTTSTKKKSKPAVVYVCRRCDSDDIASDIASEWVHTWDKESQSWVMNSMHERFFCNECREETEVDTVSLEEFLMRKV